MSLEIALKMPSKPVGRRKKNICPLWWGQSVIPWACRLKTAGSPLEDSVLEGGRIQMEKLTSSKNRGGIGLKSVEGILEKYGSGPLNGFYDKKKNRISIQFVWNWGEKRK